MSIESQLAGANKYAATQTGGTLTYKGVGVSVAVGGVERMIGFEDEGDQEIHSVEASGPVADWTAGQPEKQRTVKLTSPTLGLVDVFFTVVDTRFAHGVLVLSLDRKEVPSE